ncbi:MAG: RluA family pseudouridine synthase [Comamonadaceae bacterium]|nr:MAG: RluA family pseudouridine synthase [Comamonadaceae bacterium]
MKQVPAIISTAPPPDAGSADEEGEPLGEGGDASADSELRSFEIGADLHGARLDRALVALIPAFSRSFLQQLIEAGAVSLQGRTVRKAAASVLAGQQGAIELRPTPQSQAFRPEPMPIEVVFEDEHLRVIDKPVGLVVHPAPGHWSGTLLNGLLALDPKAVLLPRAGIVHRLDRDTSGLMVVARTRAAMDALVAAIAARSVTRQYFAIGHKAWSGPSPRQVDAAIGRDPRNRLRMAVVDLQHQSGKPARTWIDRIDSTAQACAVRCTLETGRTHQIRVHMASIGHPLVGDAVYGGGAAGGLERQGLHAWRLAFEHPFTGRSMAFDSPLPADLSSALAALGLHYNAP